MAKHIRIFSAALAAALVLMLCACAKAEKPVVPQNEIFFDNSQGQQLKLREDIEITTQEARLVRFIEAVLMQNGGIKTNFGKESSNAGQLATGDEVLLESQGIWMRYCAMTGNKQGFADAFDFVKTNLNTDKLLSYRWSPDTGAFGSNAAVDDLRIIQALLEGAEVFSMEEYEKTAYSWAKRLQKTNIKGDRILDFYDGNDAGNFITLCYIDIKTMQKLGQEIPEYNDVAERMLAILKTGYISDELPLYNLRYMYSGGSYENNDENVMTLEAAISALQLARVGECPQTTIDFLKKRVQSGELYSLYKVNGKPEGHIESTAIYAVCALIGAETGDSELALKSLERMNEFQVTKPDSVLYGAYADESVFKCYSFDNLTALLAHRAVDAL